MNFLNLEEDTTIDSVDAVDDAGDLEADEYVCNPNWVINPENEHFSKIMLIFVLVTTYFFYRYFKMHILAGLISILLLLCPGLVAS